MAQSDGRRLTDRFRDVVARGRASLRKPGRGGKGGLDTKGAVTIEYTPRLDDDPDPGEIVWTWVPYEEDPTQGKDRPVMIIGRRGDMLVGVPLTTKRDDREPQVEVGVGPWDSQHRVSYARVWRMYDVDPKQMRREGAIVERARFAAVVKAVDKYYDIRLPKATNRPV
jgi:hypothetical protein